MLEACKDLLFCFERTNKICKTGKETRNCLFFPNISTTVGVCYFCLMFHEAKYSESFSLCTAIATSTMLI